ncbi:MAG: hypothetical protein AAB834_06860, partial [Patescibacteria group bacterium]
DCFKDPYLKRPTRLTEYAQSNSGKRETAADTFAVGTGETFADLYPGATTDNTNRQNFAVLLGRMAGLEPAGVDVADALYNGSIFVTSR